MKNILICSQYFDPEPGWRGLNFARSLRQKGYNVNVLTSFPNYPLGKIYDNYKQSIGYTEIIDGINILRVPIYPSHDRSAIKRFATYISFFISGILFGINKFKNIDVIYIYNLPTVALIALWKKIWHGTPYVFNIPDMWPDSIVESGYRSKDEDELKEGSPKSPPTRPLSNEEEHLLTKIDEIQSKEAKYDKEEPKDDSSSFSTLA